MSPALAGSQAASVRQRVGPVAWCALECLAERSVDGVAEASVRAVAAELGVAKDTAQRALAALVRAGLAEPDQRRDRAGRFRPGRYLLRLDELAAPVSSPPAPRRRAPRVDGQLSLLPGA